MPVATLYCTQAELEDEFSADGVQAYTDHEQNGAADADRVTRAITRATEEINAYAFQRHSPAALAASSLINGWCVQLSLFYLCRFRGNPCPESIQEDVAEIRAKLERIPSGGFRLPGVAQRSDMRPSVSNMTVDRRHSHSPVRVDQYANDQVPSMLPQRDLQPRGPFTP